MDKAEMVKAVELAIEALNSLPERDQERLGRQVVLYVERLLTLRLEIDKGSRALERGDAVAFDAEEFLRRQNERHGGG